MKGDGRCLKLFLALSILFLQNVKGGEVGHSHNHSHSHSLRDAKVTVRCIERERQALLAFKRGLVDEFNLLSTWGSEAEKQDCCRWEGVYCSNQTGHVIQLHLGYSFLDEMFQPAFEYSFQDMSYLNLSSNSFSGELPDCWSHLENNLVMLDLSNNAFSGKIPMTIGSLFQMQTLKLRSNRFVGELPSSLKNCTSLEVIDLGDNKLSGPIPTWLGVSFNNLVILMLSSNHFNGSMPSQLCHLTRIQIMDFSVNNISGSIPKCLNNLTTLAQKGNPSLSSRHSYTRLMGNNTAASANYEDDASFIWKGRMQTYKSTLGLVKRIDLSSNRLTGEIPSEITHLVELVSLNLSRNRLTGQITPEIGNLQSLDSLDLSRNQIDGRIPTSLARIDRLSFLDLSYNNLSGKIPTGTQLQSFDPLDYAENPQLCGPPLKKMCADQNEPLSNEEDKDEFITLGFYISMGIGFAAGFWGVCGTLIFNRSWRYAYLKFLNGLNDWLYVKIALSKRQLKLAYA
ncbi:receptor-like protein 12 isoform X2 [Prunus persica]|uniref:receptor-like protein 12 isoform X2 n=1 Tax=Prunus persica TaxID=3760 RepID=UPI0009AB9DD0|nr:receptor-like protein 12 isoform X2 [Prunus persica]XP_020411979.1 receptor-like protein 12 isoform X2 [Prunus persica]